MCLGAGNGCNDMWIGAKSHWPRTRALGRIGALLLAAIFVVAGPAEGFGARECEHHGSHHAASSQDSGATATHDAAHAHGGHAAAPDDGSGHSGPCTCVGSCHASAATPLPPAGAVAAGFAPLAARADVAPSDEVRPTHPLPHVLPYAHAPPLNG